jgi:hypothetical protein
MPLALAIVLNVVFAVGLLAVLAWTMTRPGRLRPHEPAAEHVEVIQLPRGPVVEVDRRAA